MTTVLIVGGGLALFAVVIWMYGRSREKRGRISAEKRQADEKLEDIGLAKRAKESADRAARERLQERHTRK